MTKAELIEKIAAGAGLSKADASRALDSTLDAIKASLKKGVKVTPDLDLGCLHDIIL